MPVGPSLSPYDHYARHIKKKWIATDPQSGDVVVDKDAFKPRKYDDGTVEDTISGNHVEKCAGEGLSAKVEALEVHIRSIGRTLKKNEAFAVGQVGAIIDAGSATAGCSITSSIRAPDSRRKRTC